MNNVSNKKNEISEAWRQDCYNDEGVLKRNIFYGRESKKDVKKKSILVWFSKYVPSVDDKEKALIEKLISEYENVNVYFESTAMRKKFNELYHDHLIPTEQQAYSFLATSEFIFSYGILPDIFIKRKEQKHFHIAYLDNFKADRNIRARHTISSLLTNDQIIVNREDEKQMLLNTFQLSQIFQGGMITLENQDIGLIEICLLLLDNRTEDIKIDHVSADKKKVIAFLDINGNQRYQLLFRHFVSCLDFSTIDLTLLCKRKAANEEALQYINEIDSNVRVMYRVGSFSSDIDGYVNFQTINQLLGSEVDIKTALENINEDILINEIYRILPDLKFDSFLYFSGYDKLWFFLSKSIPALNKTKVEVQKYIFFFDQIDEGNAEFKHLTKNEFGKLIFNKVIFTKHNMLKDDRTRSILGECGKWALPFDLKNSYDNLFCADKEFIVMNIKKNNIKASLQVFSVPAPEDKSYISDISNNDVGELIKIFEQLNVDRKELYLISDGEQVEPLSQQHPQIKVIDRELFFTGYSYEKFFSYFDGYLCSDVHDDSPFRIACEELNIKTISIDPDKKIIETHLTDIDELKRTTINKMLFN